MHYLLTVSAKPHWGDTDAVSCRSETYPSTDEGHARAVMAAERMLSKYPGCIARIYLVREVRECVGTWTSENCLSATDEIMRRISHLEDELLYERQE